LHLEEEGGKMSSEGKVGQAADSDRYVEYVCSPLFGYAEVLAEGGEHVSFDETGEVVVTGFYNFAMPFIRYRTGDLAVHNGDSGGIVRLGKIEGRTQDYVFTNSGTRVALTPLVFGHHYHAFRHIQKWQLQHDMPGRLLVRIVRSDGFTPEDENEIRWRLRTIGDVDVEFEYVASIPLTPRGKFRFLVQNTTP
jgi:phenylacetate-CoA ligase